MPASALKLTAAPDRVARARPVVRHLRLAIALRDSRGLLFDVPTSASSLGVLAAWPCPWCLFPVARPARPGLAANPLIAVGDLAVLAAVELGRARGLRRGPLPRLVPGRGPRALPGRAPRHGDRGGRGRRADVSPPSGRAARHRRPARLLRGLVRRVRAGTAVHGRLRAASRPGGCAPASSAADDRARRRSGGGSPRRSTTARCRS